MPSIKATKSRPEIEHPRPIDSAWSEEDFRAEQPATPVSDWWDRPAPVPTSNPEGR